MIEVVASVAVSLDGYIDDCSNERLKLSSQEDWIDVLALRAQCDAILVGAGTLRADDPSLTIKDIETRQSVGLTNELIKVTVTESGDLDLNSRFFTIGNGRKFVVVSSVNTPREKIEIIRQRAEVIELELVTAIGIASALERIGVRKLMVEGGSTMLTMFFEENAVDYLRFAVAPFFVGDDKAPRFVNTTKFPIDKLHRMNLVSVRQLGDMAVMDYERERDDLYYLRKAIALSRFCERCHTSYRVGAIIVTKTGEEFTGYTHETDFSNHAEEEAIIKAKRSEANLNGATIYCSMEPCSQRASKEISCTRHIIDNKFGKVVIAFKEPDHFVVCQGIEQLRTAGVKIEILDQLSDEVRQINSHVLR